MRDDAPSDFPLLLSDALQRCARPLFEEAAGYANEHGYPASVSLESGELRLVVRQRGQGIASRYRLTGNGDRQVVVHEEFYAANREVRTLEAKVASINAKVLDSRLSAFFLKACDLELRYIEQRNPGGFW